MENDVMNKIYFLKSGEYQLSFRNSLSFLNEMTKNLGGLDNGINDSRNLLEDDQFRNFMHKKRNIKVIIFNLDYYF